MMQRKVLLVEPNYKNKYPPMGLMKIASYYRALGDDVKFFKGDLNALVLDDTYELVIEKLYANDDTIFWERYKPQICDYLKKGSKDSFEEIPLVNENSVIRDVLVYFRKYFYNKDYFKPENRKYDRIGVTTLFTFYFDITIKTINFVKNLCKDPSGIMVGGVMASILPDEVEAATGIRPFEGTLSKKGILDDNDYVIDTMPLDYSILEEIEYEYPANNGYLAYMTRGCINKCAFCAVPKLEPEYKDYLPLCEQIKEAEKRFGAKRDLLLLDNNVLASCQFNKIIDEIVEAGFGKDSKYIPPNKYEIAIQNIKDNFNKRAYIKAVVKEYKKLVEKYGKKIQDVYDLLDSKCLLNDYTAKEKNILAVHETVKPWFEEFYKSSPKKRYVDFNQGIDSRLITEENMEKLFEIPIRPVRIAFDHWELREIYEKSVRTAVKHGHTNLSNYVLYNFKDKPLDLYNRLKLNVDLCDELGVSIYSFPMKYHPIEDPDYFSNRDFIGKHWNRKFIRAIQAVLNSTKGKIGRGREFFEEAFGSSPEEFMKILWMPETFIIYRRIYDKNLRTRMADKYKTVTEHDCDLANEWWEKFKALPQDKLEKAQAIIALNKFKDGDYECDDEKILEVLSYYRITRNDAEE